MIYEFRVTGENAAGIGKFSKISDEVLAIDACGNFLFANTNPISIKDGKLSKNAIKTKNCHLLNHLNFYLTDESTENPFSVFLLTNLIVFCKYKKQQNVTPATHSKKLAKRGKTRLKRLQVTLF